MTEANTPQNLDNVFEALANRHRREIIYAVGLQPESISHLATQQELSLPAIHKHIKVLENAKVVLRQKIGRTHFVTLNREALQGLQEWVMQYQPYWGTEKETLENYETYLDKKKIK